MCRFNDMAHVTGYGGDYDINKGLPNCGVGQAEYGTNCATQDCKDALTSATDEDILMYISVCGGEMPDIYNFHATSIAEVHSEMHGLATTCGAPASDMRLTVPDPKLLHVMLTEAQRKIEAHCTGDKPDYDLPHCKFIEASVGIYTEQLDASRGASIDAGETGASEAATESPESQVVAAQEQATNCRPGQDGATKQTCAALRAKVARLQNNALQNGQGQITYGKGTGTGKGGNGDRDGGSSTAGVVVGVLGMVVGIAVALGAILYTRKQLKEVLCCAQQYSQSIHVYYAYRYMHPCVERKHWHARTHTPVALRACLV